MMNINCCFNLRRAQKGAKEGHPSFYTFFKVHLGGEPPNQIREASSASSKTYVVLVVSDKLPASIGPIADNILGNLVFG